MFVLRVLRNIGNDFKLEGFEGGTGGSLGPPVSGENDVGIVPHLLSELCVLRPTLAAQGSRQCHPIVVPHPRTPIGKCLPD